MFFPFVYCLFNGSPGLPPATAACDWMALPKPPEAALSGAASGP
jgi:hypothetical protein